VREEIHHVREGKHGARSTKQAIAIGLSKARRASVRLPAPKIADNDPPPGTPFSSRQADRFPIREVMEQLGTEGCVSRAPAPRP
jgi:hypothetical protein